MSGPTIRVEYVTPDMAQQMLGTSTGNRALKKAAVHRYARDMVTGKWLQNGEAIKFDKGGHLVDGHHRLTALVQAKVPGVWIAVVRGVAEDAKFTLDTGVGRSFVDARAVAGLTTPHSLAPILRWWYRYEHGLVRSTTVASHGELEQILAAHPQALESAQLVNRLKVIQSRCIPGVQGFVHAYASERFDREMADQFMYDLDKGAALSETSPVHVLRARLVDNPPSKGRFDPVYVLAITIKAWNAWIAGTKIKSLRWATEGDNAEAFPVFTGDELRFKAIQTKREAKRNEQLRAISHKGRESQIAKAGRLGKSA